MSRAITLSAPLIEIFTFIIHTFRYGVKFSRRNYFSDTLFLWIIRFFDVPLLVKWINIENDGN